MKAFVERLLAEGDLWVRESKGVVLQPRTVFIGGGTPTLLPMAAMRQLIQGLQKRFDFSQLQEWTIEANPATATEEYCRMLRSLGVDRLSFGAQSFNREELAVLERHHNPADVQRSIEMAQRAGFDRLNIDLIYAIPGQSLDSWKRTLEEAINLGIQHISCYGLTYESNTAITVKKRLGQIQAAEEEVELQMLHHARERLQSAGMEAYEISNYAAAGQECRHNLMYWMGEDYIALGPSGASHIQGRRWKNRPHLGEWEQAIDNEILPAIDDEILSPRQRAGELAMLMLRLKRGLNFNDFNARSGFDAHQLYHDTLERLTKIGLIHIDPEAAQLTEVGINVADAIAGEFILE